MLEPGSKVERYEIVSALGEGGMARVYKVRHTTLGTLHALKILHLGGAALHQRLVAEGRAQATLQHPNVVRVSDVLEVDGAPGLVMDFVDGPDLHRWIVDRRPDPALAEEVFRGILAGVAAAHRAGLVHRDLKPANVLMARSPDGSWLPKVGDFGLAKALESDPSHGKTKSGLPMGTPQYMAPEQIRDAASVDHRADLFSLGCILHELLAGAPAHDGPDTFEIFDAVLRGRRPPLAEVCPAAPRRLVDAVEACLVIDRDRRVQDCPALLRLLDGGAAPTPRPTPAATRRRSRVPVLAAGSAVAGLGVAAGLVAVATLALGLWLALGGRTSTCPRTADRIGFVLVTDAPRVREWLELSIPMEVRESTGSGEAPAGPVVCTLPGGSEVQVQDVVDEPDVDAVWVAVRGDRVRYPGEARRCEGRPGEVIGYARHRGSLGGIGAPTQGRTWRTGSDIEVRADYPREDNDFAQDSPVVCTLAAGTEVEVEQPPVRTRRTGIWIPVVGGAVTPPDGG